MTTKRRELLIKIFAILALLSLVLGSIASSVVLL